MHLLVVVDCTFRLRGGGETRASWEDVFLFIVASQSGISRKPGYRFKYGGSISRQLRRHEAPVVQHKAQLEATPRRRFQEEGVMRSSTAPNNKARYP